MYCGSVAEDGGADQEARCEEGVNRMRGGRGEHEDEVMSKCGDVWVGILCA